MDAMDAYHHEELPDPSTHIRLLELEQTGTRKRLSFRGRLSIWRLEKAPTYHAISYTWGDPTPTCSITIDGRKLRIPQNTFDVLRLLALQRKCRYYWIDAICIAQGSVPEKNGQVALMGVIYSRTERVLVCLDRVDDRAEEAMKMILALEKQASVKTALLALDHWDGITPGHYDPPVMLPVGLFSSTSPERRHAMEESMIAALTAPMEMSKRWLHDLLPGLADLCDRPWFRRMWVVQELVLAPLADLCCGETSLAAALVYPYLRFAHWASEAPEVFHTFEARLKELDLYMSVTELYRAREHALRLLGHRASSELKLGFLKLDVASVTDLMKNRACTERKDFIYSTLAIFDWPGMPLRPDYDKSKFQLAVDFCMHARADPDPEDMDAVIQSLGIDVNDADLQRVIASRPDPASLRSECVRRTHKPAASTPCSAVYSGVEITDESCHRCAPGLYSIESEHDSDKREFLALDVRLQDWIVFTWSGVRNEPHPGFVVRIFRGEYYIVGRAFILNIDTWGWRAGRPRADPFEFRISLNLEDYAISRCIFIDWLNPVTFLERWCNFVDDPMQELLATPVACTRCPPSYVRMVQRHRTGERHVWSQYLDCYRDDDSDEEKPCPSYSGPGNDCSSLLEFIDRWKGETYL